MKKTLLTLVILPLFTGCATFENRATCTMGGGQAFFLSLYGPVGISAKIADEDARVMCSK